MDVHSGILLSCSIQVPKFLQVIMDKKDVLSTSMYTSENIVICEVRLNRSPNEKTEQRDAL